MSDAVCDKVIEQCEDFIKDKDNHFMIQVFNDNIEALDFLTADEIADFEEQNKKAVAESLIPAYEDVIDVLSSLKEPVRTRAVCVAMKVVKSITLTF